MNFFGETYFDNKFKSCERKIRDLKINSLLDNNKKIEILKSRLKENKVELSFIKSKLDKDDIITGSLSLILYGLINRKAHDIDILISDPKRYEHYFNSTYGDEENGAKGRLGYKKIRYGNIFKSNTYEVDFFKQKDNVIYNEFKFKRHIFKIHNPLEVLKYKVYLLKNNFMDKHYNDIQESYSNLIKK